MSAAAIIVTLGIALAGASSLLWLGRRLRHRYDDTANPYLAESLRYQPLAFIASVAAVIIVRILVPGHADFVAWGDLTAPANGLGILGVAEGDSWVSVGLTFLLVMTVVTLVVMWLQVARGSGLAVVDILRAAPIASLISAVNALSEELLFRVTIAEGLAPYLPATAVALCSAAVFGLPHWFGHPGRVPGALLAAFMGWFLTMSVLQTGGLGWAWLIHLAQDVVIITLLSARSMKDRSMRSVAVAA